MQMVEVKLNMMIDENPHLIDALEKFANQPLIGQCSHTIWLKPFNFEKIQFHHEL